MIKFDRSGIDQIYGALRTYKPLAIAGDYGDAAVLLPFIENDQGELELVLTVRAAHMNSHAGEIAFPGGKVEDDDDSLIHTALRETHEEIGLASKNVRILGQLDQIISKNGIRVQPVVAFAEQVAPLTANPDELSHIFTVPLSYFISEKPVIQTYEFKGFSWKMPEYHVQNHRIWGLTAMIIVNFLNIAYKMKMPHDKRPPGPTQS
jgi:8-oxo-dGTP pyrophosphatase MutT (NUDIX family)